MKLANWTGLWMFSLSLVLRSAAAACPCAGIPACVYAEEPILFRASLAEGQTLRYDVDARLEVKGKASETIDQKLRLRFTVAHVEKDGAVVRCRVESARAHVSGGTGEAADVEWKEGDAAGSDEEPAMTRLYRRLGAAMIELSLDDHGMIRSVSGLDGVAEDGRQVRALGVLAPESASRILQGVFSMDSDGRAHKPGERWTMAQGFPAGVWMASSSTEYTFKELAGTMARVQGVTTVTAKPPRAGDGVSPRLEILSQSIKTDAEWDTATSRLAKRSTDSSVEVKASLDLKEPIESVSTSRSHFVITRVEGAEK